MKKGAFLLVSIMVLCTGLDGQNNCLDFDGLDDYVYVPFFELQREFTVELMFRAAKAPLHNNKEILFSIGPIHRLEIGLNNDSIDTQLWVYDESVEEEFTFHSSNLRDGGWHHIAYVNDTHEVLVYVDGELVYIYPFNVIGLDYRPFLRMGLSTGNLNADSYFSGQMDEVRIWNWVKNSEEINANLDCQILGNEEHLRTYWSFNQGTSAGNNEDVDRLIDLTEGSQTGYLQNFTLLAGNSNWVVSGISGALCSSIVDAIKETNSFDTSKLTVYPNPSTQYVHFESKSQQNLDVRLYNEQGVFLNKYYVRPNESIDLDFLPAGMYFFHVFSGETCRIYKMVKI